MAADFASPVPSSAPLRPRFGANYARTALLLGLLTGLVVFDAFGAYIRLILMAFAVLFCVFTRISGIPDREAATDFYPLVLGATIGMCLMASANHLLTVFLGVEMASVPSYALAGALKGRRKSSEAALKYAVFGAGTTLFLIPNTTPFGSGFGSGNFNSAVTPFLITSQSRTSGQGNGLGSDVFTNPNSFGNSFGNPFTFKLPRSGLVVQIATSTGVRGSGDVTDFTPVIPDIVVRTTAADIQKFFDPALERAVNCPAREVTSTK